jgi:phage RecT family recombinase
MSLDFKDMENNMIISKERMEVIKPSFLEQSGLSEADFKREVSFAIQLAQSNPFLNQCTKESALKAVLNVAQTGLSLNPTKKEAYLVPRYNNKERCYEVCLDPSYMGLMRLVTDAGVVSSMNIQLIYSGDVVEIDLSDEQKPIKKHVPYFLAGNEKGDIMGVYSIATLKNGTKHTEIMGREDVLAIRSRSESYKAYIDPNKKVNQAVWVTDEGEMFRKTIVKRHCKYLPKSGNEKVQNAIDISNYSMGFDEPLNHGYWAYLDKLIHDSILDDNNKTRLGDELASYKSKWQGDKLKDYLLENQPKSLNEQFKAKTI